MDRLFYLAPAFFVLAGLACLVFGVTERSWWSAFQRRAVPATGEVVGVRTTREMGSGTRVSFVHQPKVRYRGPDGQDVVTHVRYGVSRAPAIGSTLALRVDPQRPKRVVVEGETGAPKVAILVFGAIFLVVGYGVYAVVRALIG